MKLLLDIGNTRLKAAISENGAICMVDDWQKYVSEASCIAVSNVGQERPEVWEAVRGRKVITLKGDLPCVGHYIKGIYRSMGSDRIAADIAARVMCGNATALVIDCGTCITYDLIGNDGRLLGGSITPGMRLRLAAMHDYTKALPEVSMHGESPILGYSTETCMRGGVINGIKWEIEGYIRTMRKEHSDLRVFLTGGDSFSIDEDLADIITNDDMLVLKGLDIISQAQ